MELSTRPKVPQLIFQMLGRSVHPELFHVHKSKRIDRERYSAKIDITSDGHVITWMADSTILTEIAASSNQPVPQGRQIFSLPLRDTGRDALQIRDGIEYKYEYELERVPAQMFWMIQQNLGDSYKEHELIQVFDSSGRIAIGGLSFVHLEARLRSLRIRAIHTFPDDLALVKTESTFSLTDK